MTVEVITLDKAELDRIIERTAERVAEAMRNDLVKPLPELMTKNELADYLRCDVSKINRLMKEGLPSEMFGSHPRFRKADIDRYLRGNLQEVQRKAA